MISYTSNRKGAAIAILVVTCGLAALAALGVFDPGKPREAPVQVELSMDAVPPAAREALTRPAFRAYSNLGRRLPAARAYFYREHRIDGLDDSARIVRGEDGSVYFTRDDFRTVYHVR